MEILLGEWDIHEGEERRGSPQFASYFRKSKIEDMREPIAKYIMQDLWHGDLPYHQNIHKAVNIIVWLRSGPTSAHRALKSSDFAESFEIKTELAWFGISEKWEVKESYQSSICQKSTWGNDYRWAESYNEESFQNLSQMLKCTSNVAQPVPALSQVKLAQ